MDWLEVEDEAFLWEIIEKYLKLVEKCKIDYIPTSLDKSKYQNDFLNVNDLSTPTLFVYALALFSWGTNHNTSDLEINCLLESFYDDYSEDMNRICLEYNMELLHNAEAINKLLSGIKSMDNMSLNHYILGMQFSQPYFAALENISIISSVKDITIDVNDVKNNIPNIVTRIFN